MLYVLGDFLVLHDDSKTVTGDKDAKKQNGTINLFKNIFFMY
jgi:hypothetical protein